MRFDFVRLAVHDVDAATVRFPAGNAGSEMFVGVRNAFVVIVFVFVVESVRARIAAQPEGFDELFALFIGFKSLERGPFLIGNDVGNIFIEPLLEGSAGILQLARFPGLLFCFGVFFFLRVNVDLERINDAVLVFLFFRIGLLRNTG